MTKDTPLGCEYVADERRLETPGRYDVTTTDAAVELVLEYLRERLDAVFRAWPQRPVIMLSGGIDSILIAAVAAEPRNDLLALTFRQPGMPGSMEEGHTAALVAGTLGMEHAFVQPDEQEFRDLATGVVARLDNSEPWEVLAGIILAAVDEAAREQGADGALISGGGADALFLGGEVIDSGQDDGSLLQEWDRRIRAKVRKNFTRDRYIPDFYGRLIDDENRHIQVWQTHAATELALRLHPTVVRGPQVDQDKVLFRRAAIHAGVPEPLVSRQKNPMQVSSGGLETIVRLARADLAKFYRDRTYSDPLKEPLEFVVARMWLRTIHDQDG